MRLINWGVKQPGQWNPLLPMAYQDQFFVRFSGLSSRREELLKENNTAERATRLERTGTTMNPNGQYLRDEQVEPQKPELYYGVLGLNGLETLMAAELWNNNDHPAHAGNMRGGGKNFWLNWCQNGGRNGDSMPFSIWLHPDDFAYIRDNEDEGFGLLGSLINAEIVIDGSDTGEKFMMHLWPWNQHAQVVMQRVNDRIADESDYWEDEAEAKEGMQSIMGEEWVSYARTNAQTRGKVEGLIRPEVEWKP